MENNILGRTALTNDSGCTTRLGLSVQAQSASSLEVFGLVAHHNAGTACNANDTVGSGTAVNQGQWYHAGLTFNGETQLIEYYLDGVLINSATWGGTGDWTTSGSGLYFGEQGAPGMVIGLSIDETKIYDYVRTPQQIVEDMNAGHPAPGSPIGSALGHWKFDKGYGTAAYDHGTGGNNLTLTGSYSWSNDGKFNKAIDYSSGYGSASDSSSLSITGRLTLSSWIKPDVTTPSALEMAIAGKWDGATDHSYILTQRGDEIRMYIDSTDDYVTTTSTNLQTGTYYYVAGVYNATAQTLDIYVNGILQPSSTTGTIPSSIGDDTGGFYVGDHGSFGGEGSTTVNLQVGANDDDGSSTSADGIWHSYGNYDNSYSNTNHIPLGGTEGDDDVITTGLRFTSVSIPQYSFIGSATLDFMEDWGGGYSTSVKNRIYASDESSCSLGSGNLPSSKSKTDAYQDWDSNGSQGSAGQWYQANATVPPPDITSAIQEIVNRGDWSSSNDLCVLIEDDGSTTDWWFEPRSYESGSSNAAKLDITYGGIAPYDGIIDEVKLYNSALTASQIRVLYAGGASQVLGAISTDGTGPASWAASAEYCPPGDSATCNPPVAEWKFDEKAGTSAYDTSENNNTGAITGAEWTHAGKCKEGACLYFDGTGAGQYINAGSDPSISNLSDNAFTVEAWIKPDGYGISNAGYFFRKDDGGAGFGLGFTTGSSSGLHSRVGCATTDAQSNAGLDEFSADSQWHHVAMTFDDAGDRYIYQYIDGKPVDSYSLHDQCIDAVENDSSENLYLGNGGDNPLYEFEGNIDEIRIFDYVRTPAQIAWSYNKGGPVGWWKFDECSGTTANDSGSGGNNGTITPGDATGNNDSTGTKCGMKER